MTKRNLIVLIVGVVILLILVGWFSYTYFQNKNKPVAVTPTSTPQPTITFSKDEEKTLSQLMGLPSDQIPGVYKEKVALYKEKLKNDCLGKKEDVKQFLVAVKNDDSIGNLLTSMKDITVSMDFIPNKTPPPPQGKDTGFKMNKLAVFECYNLDKDKFEECQSRLNGLEINSRNDEEAVLEKYTNFFTLIPNYLQCEAVEQKDINICSKFFFSVGFKSDCEANVRNFTMLTGVTFHPNCENFCQKFAVNIDEDLNTCTQDYEDELLSVRDCVVSCQALNAPSATDGIKACQQFKCQHDKVFCESFVTLDPNHCLQMDGPRYINVKQVDGVMQLKDRVGDCQRTAWIYKAIKENNPSILDQFNIKLPEVENPTTESGIAKGVNSSHIYFLKRLYFENNNSCDTDFNKLYENYCNLKYGS